MPRSCNVFDIVRGALVYETMSGIVAAGKALMSHDNFIVYRMKNRFYPRYTATVLPLSCRQNNTPTMSYYFDLHIC